MTGVADVVLPVAPHAEKVGAFVNWEGRVRPFQDALDSNAMSDHRVLDTLAAELGYFLETRTQEQIHEQFTALGPWTGDRGAGDGAAASPDARTPDAHGQVRPGDLADPARRGTPAGRRAVPRGHRATRPSPGCPPTDAERLGVVDGERVTVSSARGAVTCRSRDRPRWSTAWSGCRPTPPGCAVRTELGARRRRAGHAGGRELRRSSRHVSTVTYAALAVTGCHARSCRRLPPRTTPRRTSPTPRGGWS